MGPMQCLRLLEINLHIIVLLYSLTVNMPFTHLR